MFQVLLFNNDSSILDISIWPIVETLTGATTTTTTTTGQSGPGRNGDEGCSTFPKAPGMEPHYQMV